jgi:hypothetical protein
MVKAPELCRRDFAVRLEEFLLVEPVHPLELQILDLAVKDT